MRSKLTAEQTTHALLKDDSSMPVVSSTSTAHRCQSCGGWVTPPAGNRGPSIVPGGSA